jgi:hypothetical protein
MLASPGTDRYRPSRTDVEASATASRNATAGSRGVVQQVLAAAITRSQIEACLRGGDAGRAAELIAECVRRRPGRLRVERHRQATPPPDRQLAASQVPTARYTR